MSTAQLQADIADWIINATFWTSLAFVAGVSTYWYWWREFYGRVVIIVDILFAAAFLGPEIGLLIGHPVTGSLVWLTLSAFALVPLRTVVLALAIWRLQHKREAAV